MTMMLAVCDLQREDANNFLERGALLPGLTMRFMPVREVDRAFE